MTYNKPEQSNGKLPPDVAGPSLNAIISLTGWLMNSDEDIPFSHELLLHVLHVSDPISEQSWIVLRKYKDFSTFASLLDSLRIPNLPAFPSSSSFSTSSVANLATSCRNALQEWLSQISNLRIYPNSSNSLLQQFLSVDKNMYSPHQIEGVHWIAFTNHAALFDAAHTQTNHASANSTADTSGRQQSLDEMEMEDMFGYGAHYNDFDHEEDEESFDEDEHGEIQDYSAATRYQKIEEAITKEDVMEIQQEADEVEMVEDVGSLAQSLGASYLGRSLQLQAEMQAVKKMKKEEENQNFINLHQNILSGTTSELANNIPTSTGGIGGAVEQASALSANSNASLLGAHQNAMTSPPRLDSFKMIKVIGKGSFGKVFLVKEIKTGEMFALKVLRKDNIIKRNQVEHTRTERSVLGYVKHPFIVGLNMAFQSKDKLYFVLDYCAGGELFFHLGKVGKFPEPRACFYTAEIILAISYVHHLGIIYRDLKPENVLLDAGGHIRLTDFGLSKEGIISSSSGAYSFCGTPEYLAPEILNRQGHGRAVDWWSLGALLYEQLSGLPPFYCRDREKLFEKIRKSDLTYPRYLSTRATSLLRGLLTRDPKRRLGSGENDAEEIKRHSFFSDIDWNKLAEREIPPPWDPQLSGSLDTRMFDREFTSMPIFSPNTNQAHGGFAATPQENIFEGFTYTDRTFHHP